MFELFGIQGAGELPSAAVSRIGDGLPADRNWWLHADPVHLKADIDRLLLADTHWLDLQADEGDLIARELAGFLEERGWHLEAHPSGRWYLRVPPQRGLTTHALSEVVGRNIRDYLPEGEQGKAWVVALNEIQMFLHSAEGNQLREARGRPAINSLWLWGGGALPKASPQCYDAVYCDDPLSRGMARLGGVPSFPLPADLQEVCDAGGAGARALIVDQCLLRPVMDADPRAWDESVDEFARRWLTPLRTAVRHGRITRASVYPCDGRSLCLSRRQELSFWKPVRPLSRYLGQT